MNLKKSTRTILLAFAIISFWRGVWGLMDLYLYPSNLTISFSISILIGIVTVYSIKHKFRPLI